MCQLLQGKVIPKKKQKISLYKIVQNILVSIVINYIFMASIKTPIFWR